MIYNRLANFKLLRMLARSLNSFLSRFGLKLVPKPMSLVDLKVNLCIDVGANIGQYGLSLLRNGYGGHILSIEPQPSAHSQLVNNAKDCPKWIVADPCVVGDFEGDIVFQIAANSFSSSVLKMNKKHIEAAPESAPMGTITIPQYKLNSIVERHLNILDFKYVYLKLDTQGYEKNILNGISESLWSKIVYVELELSLVELYSEQELFGYYLEYLRSREFILINLQSEFTDVKTGEILQLNGLFKRVNY